MAVPSEIGDIAVRLAADLHDVAGSWTVEVIAEAFESRDCSPAWFPSFDAAPPPAGQTYVTPWPFPEAISIRRGGREELLLLAFWSVGAGGAPGIPGRRSRGAAPGRRGRGDDRAVAAVPAPPSCPDPGTQRRPGGLGMPVVATGVRPSRRPSAAPGRMRVGAALR